jgi:hypothetical protein
MASLIDALQTTEHLRAFYNAVRIAAIVGTFSFLILIVLGAFH